MALASNIVWELRTTGNDDNGGGYKTGASGTDWSIFDAAQYTFTTATTAGVDAIFLDAQAAADMVGNILNITGGTNFTAGSYEVISVVVGVSMTLDRNCTTVGAGALGAAKLGGAKLTFAEVDDDLIDGHVCYIKAGTYTLTTKVLFTLDGGSGQIITIAGYDTNRNLYNTDTKPLITTSTNSTILFEANSADYVLFYNISFSNTAATRAFFMTCISAASTNIICHRCIFDGFSSVQDIPSSDNLGMEFFDCEMKHTTGYAVTCASTAGTVALRYCYIHDCNGGVRMSSTGSAVTLENCIFDTITNTACDLTRTTTSFPSPVLINNAFYNCDIGVNVGANAGVYASVMVIRNNIFYGGRWAIYFLNSHTTQWARYYFKNAFGNQSTSRYNGWADPFNSDITLTANPFTDVVQLLSVADGDSSSTTTLHSATGGFTAGMVGHTVTISGGTLTAGYYTIVTHTDTNNVVLDRALNTGSGSTCKVSGNSDFSLNSTAGGGTLLRQVEYPTTMPGGLTDRFNDIGPAQHLEVTPTGQISSATVQ